MELIKEIEKYDYEGLCSFPSFCGLKLYKNNDGTPLVVMKESPDNPGTSITNASETIAEKIYNEFYKLTANPEDITWIESYQWEDDDITYDVISFYIRNGKFMNPSWRRVEPWEVFGD